ncbi:MAG: methylenetetrahydrofolate reductase [Prosthecobacter sp.]
MHITDILSAARGTTAFSFEFFPPRSPAAVKTLQSTIDQLAPLRPAFASITYGAGGSTRELTQGLVTEFTQSDVYDPIPHLTCVGHSEAEIMALLTHYAAAGVSNILALRGDLPAGQTDTAGVFAHAADLVRYIKNFNERGLHPHPKGFGVGVACFPEGHPATPNRMLEMDHLKAKVDAGADWLCTQAFFDNHAFHDYRARCDLAGITAPILAGILPLTTASGMKRMAELAGGMRYPARLIRALNRDSDDDASFRRIALHHATEQCANLLDHEVAGIHLYTLNQAAPVLEIHARLGFG